MCPCVYQSLACLCDKLWPFPARITKFGPEVQNNLVKIHIFCGAIDLGLGGQIELHSQNLPHFELVHAITDHQLKQGPPYLEKDAKQFD